MDPRGSLPAKACGTLTDDVSFECKDVILTSRIAIDMQGALTDGSRPRGIGRYTSDLVSAMVRLRGPSINLIMNDNFRLAARETWDGMKELDPSITRTTYRVPTLTNLYETRTSTRRRIADSIARRHVAGAAPDVLLFSSLFEAAPPDFRPIDLRAYPARVTAAILYDLIPLVFAEAYLADERGRGWYLDAIETLKTADLLLAISESAKQDAVRLLHVSPERIAVVGAAANERFKPSQVDPARASELKSRFGLSRDFVMYVAGADLRKNLRGVIEAVAAVPRGVGRKLQILLVTNADAALRESLAEDARACGLSHDAVRIAHKVDDDDLVALLNLCRALVFPSRYEGFGLPVLEAMQCGTPVVVARTSSLPEIVNREDILYNVEKPERAGAILHRLLTDDPFRSDVSRWGVRRSAAFSWDRTARLALQALDDAASTSASPSVVRHRLLDLDDARREFADLIRPSRAEDASVGSFVGDLLFSVPSFGEKRRLLIDVTECAQGDVWTGIQRVVRKLTAAFYRDGAERPEMVPLAVRLDGPKPTSAMAHVALSLGEAEAAASYEVEVRRGDDLFMLDSTWLLYEGLSPVFKRVRQHGGRIFTCVYDLIPELHPHVCGEGMPAAHARWLRSAVAESDGLICISRAVADELLSYIADHELSHREGLRVGWFHCGSDIDGFHSVKPVREEVRAAFPQDTPAFLAVGTLEPRKCHALALDAFELLWSRGVDARLVFIGARGWKIDAMAERIRSHPEHGVRLFWFEGASDNDLSHAYERAAAVVSMSMAEGFGLPLAEAARLDKPVICSDIAVFREVGGEGAAYFASEDAASMADTVEGWLAGRLTTDPSKVSRSTWMDAARQIGNLIYGGEWYR